MIVMVLGLVMFLGVHSVRVVADDWRASVIASRGEGTWKGLYSLLSIVGLVLIVYGYGLARTAPVELWSPPTWTRHAAALLTLLSFVLFAAAQVRGTMIKAAVHHPQVLGTKVWAFAHLMSNGRLAFVGSTWWASAPWLLNAAKMPNDRMLSLTPPASAKSTSPRRNICAAWMMPMLPAAQAAPSV